MPVRRVCVVGAGASGITCVRQLRDEGHDVLCYETTGGIGGLWSFREEVIDGLPSVSRATIANTSKEYAAFSDFPAPEHFPNFMHNKQMLEYLQLYVKANGIEQFIRFRHRVTNITFADDHRQTGRWKVSVLDLENNNESCEIFDGVMIASGIHTTPREVRFPGQQLFSGRTLHTHAFKDATPFRGKKVCVIGSGNSAIDAIVELCFSADQVLMSTRRGVWIRPRVGLSGWPTDSWLSSRAVASLLSLLPSHWSNSLMESLVNSRMHHGNYGLKPRHRILEQHPVTNDALPNAILSGRVAVRPNVKHFTEKGIVFEGETTVTEVDVVIFGTGYEHTIPFIEPSIISASETTKSGGLYKMMFNPQLRHSHTLAVIGMVHPLGPLNTTSEMQARLFSALMSGWVKLPDRQTMVSEVRKQQEFNRKLFYESPRHTIQSLYIPYMEDLAAMIGCSPHLSKYLLTDPLLWYHMVFGLFSTYQFRVEGRHQWHRARQTILDTKSRILSPIRPQFHSLMTEHSS